jgi:hydrogenase nickel incorporation protein HypA/HybF
VHEKALMDDVMRQVAAVAAREGAVRVTGVRVWLGALSHFTPEHFAAHFEDAACGTAADGARVTATLDDDPAHPRSQGVVIESVEVLDDGADPAPGTPEAY